MIRRPFLLPSMVLFAIGLFGCGPSLHQEQMRPFFQQEYDVQGHGRKTLFDRIVETDPGQFHVLVAPDYLDDPPEKIAVLPFADLGSANFVVNKIPLTFRDRKERANWAWTDAQRLRRAMDGYLAGREFEVMNPIGIDAVLKAHGVRNYYELNQIPPQTLGQWLGVDAVVYGEVTHYEAYYAFLVSAWEVGIAARMVSTHDGHTLIRASGSRYDVTLMPALDVEDMAINSGLALLELRDINLARAEEEACREVVKRIPVSKTLEQRLAQQALEYDEETESRRAHRERAVSMEPGRLHAVPVDPPASADPGPP